jgi:hypothetical protein
METVGKSKISLETRRRYAESARESALARLTAEQLEERRKRDAVRSAARRAAQRNLSAPSARAMMTPEQLAKKREADKIASANYRRRKAGLAQIPTLTELRYAQQGRLTQSAAPRMISSPPTFEEIAKADAKLLPGYKGTIEMHPLYKHSDYAFPLRPEDIAAENLERMAMHPTGKRVQHYMMPSVEKKQRTEGGKKTKKAAQKKK